MHQYYKEDAEHDLILRHRPTKMAVGLIVVMSAITAGFAVAHFSESAAPACPEPGAAESGYTACHKLIPQP